MNQVLKSFKGNSRGSSFSKKTGNGFTLIELLVVIAIIAILAAMLIPVLAKAKLRAQSINCISDMKQLQTGAILYGSENNDSLPANVTLRAGGDTSCGGPNWVDGVFWSPDNNNVAQNPVGCETNAFYLGVYGEQGFGVRLLGSIGPYAKAAGVYHCPGDVWANNKTSYHQVRVRSCSANAYLDGTGIGPGATTGYKIFKKFSNFTARLSVSDCFLYLDENPDSINDGWFLFNVGNAAPGINDTPAVNHGKASAFSFVDGHAEIHKWQDVFLDPTAHTGGPGGKDTLWLSQHGTCKN